MRQRPMLDGAVTQLALDVTSQQSSVANDALHRHYTPQRLADAIVDLLVKRELLDLHDGWIAEPSVGGGAFVRAVHRAQAAEWPPLGEVERAFVLAIDKDPGAQGLQIADLALVGDARELLAGYTPKIVIGNPPFGGPSLKKGRSPGDPPYVGAEHVRAALAVAPVVALILPFAWLAVDALGPLLFDRDPPREVFRILGRPWRLTRDVALYVWHGSRRETVISRDRIAWGS